MISLRRAQAGYRLLVAVLFTLQAVYTRVGLERLWYEELAESIRNPFWLDHRFVYDGVSTNVAWYGLVLVANKAFGFSVYAGKYVRLAASSGARTSSSPACGACRPSARF